MSASSAPVNEFSAGSVTIRRACPEDAEACGKICYEAFRAIATAHNFTPDIPSPEVATAFLSTMFDNDGVLLRCGATGRTNHREQLLRRTQPDRWNRAYHSRSGGAEPLCR